MDIWMMIVIACVIIMPVIIITLAKKMKVVADMKAEKAAKASADGSKEDA